MSTSAKPKTKWGDRQGRRRDILAAARRLLERDGYAGLSMRAVADLAAVSPGTVYTYVSGKEELFAVLCAERLELLEQELREQAFIPARSGEDVLVALMERYFEVYAVFGREIDVWSPLTDAGSLPVDAAERVVAAGLAVISTVREALERFEPDFANAAEMELAVPVLWASLNGLAEHFSGARQTLHPYPRAELTTFAARMLLAGVRAALAVPDSTTTEVHER